MIKITLGRLYISLYWIITKVFQTERDIDSSIRKTFFMKSLRQPYKYEKDDFFSQDYDYIKFIEDKFVEYQSKLVRKQCEEILSPSKRKNANGFSFSFKDVTLIHMLNVFGFFNLLIEESSRESNIESELNKIAVCNNAAVELAIEIEDILKIPGENRSIYTIFSNYQSLKRLGLAIEKAESFVSEPPTWLSSLERERLKNVLSIAILIEYDLERTLTGVYQKLDLYWSSYSVIDIEERDLPRRFCEFVAGKLSSVVLRPDQERTIGERSLGPFLRLSAEEKVDRFLFAFVEAARELHLFDDSK